MLFLFQKIYLKQFYISEHFKANWINNNHAYEYNGPSITFSFSFSRSRVTCALEIGTFKQKTSQNYKGIILLNCYNRSVYKDYSLSLLVSRMSLYLGSTSTGESPTGPEVRPQ